MNKIKNHLRERFTMIPNDLINDPDIDLIAKGIFMYMASKEDGWKFNNSDLMNVAKIKDRRTLGKYMKQLLDPGWLTRDRERKEGKYSLWDYEIHPEPVCKKCTLGPGCNFCTVQKMHPLINKEPINKKESNETDFPEILLEENSVEEELVESGEELVDKEEYFIIAYQELNKSKHAKAIRQAKPTDMALETFKDSFIEWLYEKGFVFNVEWKEDRGLIKHIKSHSGYKESFDPDDSGRTKRKAKRIAPDKSREMDTAIKIVDACFKFWDWPEYEEPVQGYGRNKDRSLKGDGWFEEQKQHMAKMLETEYFDIGSIKLIITNIANKCIHGEDRRRFPLDWTVFEANLTGQESFFDFVKIVKNW
jgi:hypothetical protein